MTEVRSAGFAQEIVNALGVRSPQDSINAIKNAVIKELETLDRSVSIRDTSYFNHTYAPDLILNWDATTERPVYLRFTDNLLELREGISRLDFENAFVFGLTRPQEDAEGFPQLEQSAQDHHALITDADGIETLINQRSKDAGVNLLGQALTRGGRGLLAQPQAEAVAKTVSEGFSAALETQSAPTRLAVDAIAQYLDDPQAARMTRVLQAVWEGSDGRIDQFPGPADLSKSLNDDSLQYILDVVSASDRNFWRRIGRFLTTSQLSRMSLNASNEESFQNLINANLDVIPCRAAAVASGAETLFSADREPFLWSIRRKTLALEGPDFTAFVADRKELVEGKVAAGDLASTNGLDVETLSRRVAEYELTEVTLRDGGATVQFTSNEGVGHDERLAKLAQGLSSNSTVVKAVVPLPEGQLALNFKTSLVNAKTTRTPLLKDVLAVSIPLLHELPEDRRQALKAFLQVGDSVPTGNAEDLLGLLAEKLGED
ncbi:hypothetical protein SAMN05660473_00673 [Arthrobacter sp. 49Tsu3.1M3]|uniref:hypothetical protein n=1 Tax=Arthrobacter sp. 49Tsu3.1M3 TaxID=1279029 RepID=UPI0009D367FB|nr:hypothetical protein [Arthrobacter sp. 49Tsu3.1M3]SKB43645.1 hypothetical protein SAMN05660473_00673 [Arthrobacter sp. 49Tsu3.1M3]